MKNLNYYISLSLKILLACSLSANAIFYVYFEKVTDSLSSIYDYGSRRLEFEDLHSAANVVTKLNSTELFQPFISRSSGEIAKPSSLRPALVLHVGPQKTGSTSVQLNVIQKKNFRLLLQKDHYQEIVGFNFRKFKKLRKECLEVPQKCNYSYWNQLMTLHRQAYNNTAAGKMIKTIADGRNHTSANEDLPIYALHSNEEWSMLPQSNLTFSLLEDIFEPWDSVHVIIFYRPFVDWLPSRYAQYRKAFLFRPLMKQPWNEQYRVKRDEQMTFPEFLRDSIKSDRLRDTLGTFEFYQRALSHVGIHKIHIMQTYGPDEIEREFLCKLPGATKSCSHINDRIGYKGKRRNKVNLPLNLDLIIVEAWHQNLVSVKRHSAAIALEEKMRHSNITMSKLPQICISKYEEEWLWNRTLMSEKMFGESSLKSRPDSSDEATEAELRSKFENNLLQEKYCSVNATAALEIDWFRSIFDDCSFHSPHFLTRTLKDDKPDDMWVKLGCSSSFV